MELWQSFKETPIKECPECRKLTLVRLFGVPFIFTKGEPKTLEHQADRNSKRMGANECQEREEKAKERVAQARGKKVKQEEVVPFWRSGAIDGLIKSDTPIKPPQVTKYIDELKSMGCNVDTHAEKSKDGK